MHLDQLALKGPTMDMLSSDQNMMVYVTVTFQFALINFHLFTDL